MAEEGPGPAVFSLQQFEIVDGSLPANWVMSISPKGGFTLGPEAWSKAGFWERFFDGDSDAGIAFESEMRKILK